MITTWKRALLGGASDIFGKGNKSRKEMDSTVGELHRQIGKLKVDNDFLSERSPIKRRCVIDR